MFLQAPNILYRLQNKRCYWFEDLNKFRFRRSLYIKQFPLVAPVKRLQHEQEHTNLMHQL